MKGISHPLAMHLNDSIAPEELLFLMAGEAGLETEVMRDIILHGFSGEMEGRGTKLSFYSIILRSLF